MSLSMKPDLMPQETLSYGECLKRAHEYLWIVQFRLSERAGWPEKGFPKAKRLYVPNYGHAVAEDTGRNIKGRRIDLWMPSRGAAIRFGVQKLRIRLLKAKRECPAKTRQAPSRRFSPCGRVF